MEVVWGPTPHSHRPRQRMSGLMAASSCKWIGLHHSLTQPFEVLTCCDFLHCVCLVLLLLKLGFEVRRCVGV